jgi:hypothetical protein
MKLKFDEIFADVRHPSKDKKRPVSEKKETGMDFTKFGEITGTPCSEAAGRCNRMFIDAHNTESKARVVFANKDLDEESLQQYVSQKFDAERKMADACDEWLRIRKILFESNGLNPNIKIH